MPDNEPASLRVERIPAGYGILVGTVLNLTGWRYILVIFNQTSVLPGMWEYFFAPVGVLGGLLLIALSIRNSNGVGLAGLYVAFPGWILYIVVVVERVSQGGGSRGCNAGMEFIPFVCFGIPLSIIGHLLVGVGVLKFLFSKPTLPPNICCSCGYDLRGLPEPRCPECGTPFNASTAQHRPESESNGESPT